MIDIAESAAKDIRKIYYSDNKLTVTIKDDDSPVTNADSQADKFIRAELAALTPDIPIISEEYPVPDFSERKHWDYFWLVDPLDGTKEFIERTDDFTVNIALMKKSAPLLGVISNPVSKDVFSWWDGADSTKCMNWNSRDIITLRRASHLPDKIRVLASRRHNNSDHLKAWLDRFSFDYEIIVCGSSLKMCMLAQNLGDMYVRLGPTSEWDTAAGHGILKGVGGEIYVSDDTFSVPLTYNCEETVINPEFVAVRSQALLSKFK